MKNRAGHFISEFANNIMVYIIYLTAVVFSQIWITKELSFISLPILGVLVLFCYFSRTGISNFVFYGLSHLVIGALLFFLPKSFGKTELIVSFVLMFILDLAYWIRRKTGGFSYPGIAFVFMSAAAYLFADIKKNRFGMIFFFILGIVYFVLYYIRLFFSNAGKLAKEGEEDRKMPYKEMLKNGGSFAIPFVAVSAAVMVLAKVDAFDYYTVIFLKFLGSIALKIVESVIFVINWIGNLFSGINAKNNLPIQEMMDGIDTDGPLSKILSMAFAVAVVLLFLFVLVRGIIAIIKTIQLNRRMPEQIIEKDDMVEIRRRIPKSERSGREKVQGIRKVYKRTVEKAVKKGYPLKRSQTPRERALDLKNRGKEDITELSLKYEKVRYKV